MSKYLIVYETMLYDLYATYTFAENKKEALKKFKENHIYGHRVVAIRRITKNNRYL